MADPVVASNPADLPVAGIDGIWERFTDLTEQMNRLEEQRDVIATRLFTLARKHPNARRWGCCLDSKGWCEGTGIVDGQRVAMFTGECLRAPEHESPGTFWVPHDWLRVAVWADDTGLTHAEVEAALADPDGQRRLTVLAALRSD